MSLDIGHVIITFFQIMKRSCPKQSSLMRFVIKKRKTESTSLKSGSDKCEITPRQKPENDSNQSHPMINKNNMLDIGLFVSQTHIDDFTRSLLLKSPWIPNAEYKFPALTKRNLRFQLSWLERFSWLAYSDVLQGALCKYCTLFAPKQAGKGSNQQLGLLVSKPYSNWKNALEDFAAHSLASYHVKSAERAENFLKIMDGKQKAVSEQMQCESARQDADRRRILKPIIETVVFCGRQEIALRGKKDSGNVIEDSNNEANDGNFRSLLRFRINSGDGVLKEHLKNGSRNAQYTSPIIQNQIIDICRQLIQENLVKNINNSQCFSVLADETTDISGIEQLSLCVRHIDVGTLMIREDFLMFVPVIDLTGQALAKVIIDNLKQIGINCKYMIGQGYDGAASMSGYLNGAQAIVRKSCPMALFMHCGAHSLNLALADSCSLPPIRNCIGTVQTICSFFRQSAKHNNFLKKAITMKLPDSRQKVLLAMCETRWVYKHESILRFKEMYPAIIEALLQLVENVNRDNSQKAQTLFTAISHGQFVISLLVLEKVFGYTLDLSKSLQSSKCDICAALEHVDNVLSCIKELRENADEHFCVIYEEASSMVESADGVLKIPRLCSKSMHRGNIPATSAQEYFKRTIFLPFLDNIISQLDRFQRHKNVITNLCSVLPSRCVTISEEFLNSCIEFYKEIIPEPGTFAAEFSLWKNKWKREEQNCRPNNPLEAFAACNSDFFPNIKKLLQILATLPVSTATPERSFSTLKKLKSYLRNSTSENRLTGLALLSVYRNMNLDTEDIIMRFLKNPRRIT